MKERHVSRVLKKCCRVCGKSSPKTKIFFLRIEHAQWFGLNNYEGYNICWICDETYNANKGQEFELVKNKFKLPNSELIATDNCTVTNPCYFCKLDGDWKDAKDIDKREKEVNLRKRSQSVQKFLKTRILEGHGDVHLSHVYHKKELVENCMRIEYHGKPRDFLLCEICPEVITYNESSITGFKHHVKSKKHQDKAKTAQPTSISASSESSTSSSQSKIKPSSDQLRKFDWRKNF